MARHQWVLRQSCCRHPYNFEMVAYHYELPMKRPLSQETGQFLGLMFDLL